MPDWLETLGTIGGAIFTLWAAKRGGQKTIEWYRSRHEERLRRAREDERP